jgi:hypothetical protein
LPSAIVFRSEAPQQASIETQASRAGACGSVEVSVRMAGAATFRAPVPADDVSARVAEFNQS